MKIQYWFTLSLLAFSLSLLAQELETTEEDKPVEATQPIAEESPMPDLGTPPLPSEGLPASLDENKSKQISNYFDEALKNYEDILGSVETSDIETGKKREIKNREILKEKQTLVNQSEARLRQLKKEYLQRYLTLKNSYEQGRLDKKIYHQQLDKLAKDYSYQIKSLKEDIEYNRVQSEKTSERLKTLEELNRINTILMEQEGRTPKAEIVPAEPKRIPTDIEFVIPRIEAAGCFKKKDFWTASDIK